MLELKNCISSSDPADAGLTDKQRQASAEIRWKDELNPGTIKQLFERLKESGYVQYSDTLDVERYFKQPHERVSTVPPFCWLKTAKSFAGLFVTLSKQGIVAPYLAGKQSKTQHKTLVVHQVSTHFLWKDPKSKDKKPKPLNAESCIRSLKNGFDKIDTPILEIIQQTLPRT